MAGQVDGSLNFDTNLNATGFHDGINKISSLSKDGAKALEGLKGVGEKVGQLTWDAFSATIKATAVSMTALTAGAGAFLTSSVKVGAEFDTAMSQVLATAGITKDTVENGVNTYDKLSQVAKDLGSSTQFSATEAAEALNYLVAAGYDAEKAAGALPAVLDLAASGGLDLAYASDLAVDSMAALGIEGTAENLTTFADQIAVAAQVSNAGVEDIGEAILTVGGTAKDLAGGTVELNAALGVLANRGIKGAEGGTALRNMILALGAPTDTASQKIEELGLQVYDAEGKMRPINDIFEDMNGKLSTMSQEEKNIALSQIFNKIDLKSSQALLAGVGEEFDSFAQSIENSEGAGAQMAETMNDNLAGSIKSFKAALEGVQLAVSENLENPLKTITQNGTKYMRELGEAMTAGGFVGLGEVIGDVLLEALDDNGEILSKAVITGQTVINAIINGIRDNSEAISEKLVSGITTSLYAINDNFTGFYNLGLKMVSQIAEGLADNPDFITDLVNDFVSNISSSFIRYSGKIIDSGVTISKALLKGILKSSKGMAGDISNFFKDLGKLFVDEFPEIFDLGVGIVTTLINGISDGMKDSNITAKDIIDTIATAVSNNGDRLLDSAWTIVSAIGEGIGQSLPQLAGYAMDIILTLAEFIGLHAEEIGSGAMGLILALANTLITEDNLNRLIDSAIIIVTKFIDGMLSDENIKLLTETVYEIIDTVTSILFGTGGGESKINDLAEAGGYIAGKLLGGFAKMLFDTDKGIFPILTNLIKGVGEYLSENFWDLGTMFMEGFASGMSGIDFSFEEWGAYIFDAKQDGTLWSDYFKNASEMWGTVFGFQGMSQNTPPPASNPLFTGENESTEGQAIINTVAAQQNYRNWNSELLASALPFGNSSGSASQNSSNSTVQLYMYPNSDMMDEAYISSGNRVTSRNGGYNNE